MALSESVSLPQVKNYGRDIALAVGIITILSILFLPIPPFLIDFGLALSIAVSVLILMVALWMQRPLDFTSFPTILLIVTMLRLALSIATTRAILSNGDEGTNAAGYVIGGFSNLVMAGDFVIGLIVFLILITVNFIVITKGATRIAEVGARFTLDAMLDARWPSMPISMPVCSAVKMPSSSVRKSVKKRIFMAPWMVLPSLFAVMPLPAC